MTEIEVQRTGSDGITARFAVRVIEAGSETAHEVTLSVADFERLGPTSRSPEELVERSIRFLLDREPKESILPSFDLTEIARYFPEYEQEIAGG